MSNAISLERRVELGIQIPTKDVMAIFGVSRHTVRAMEQRRQIKRVNRTGRPMFIIPREVAK